MLLHEYLEKHEMTPHKFHKISGLSQMTIERIVDGEQVNLTIKTIKAIEKATGGEVTYKDLSKRYNESLKASV